MTIFTIVASCLIVGHGTCCEGSMGHVARAQWDMLRGLNGTCRARNKASRLTGHLVAIFLIQGLLVH